MKMFQRLLHLRSLDWTPNDDAIVEAANKHFASDTSKHVKDSVTTLGRPRSANPQSIHPQPVGLVEENSQQMLRGVEGYCGSAAQLDWLAERGCERLKSDQAMLLIHALNPYGFAWDRPVTEEGCDLNRNFLDFTARYLNAAYDLLADCLVPCELDGPLFISAEATTEEFRRTHGDIALQKPELAGSTDITPELFSARLPLSSQDKRSNGSYRITGWNLVCVS